MTNPPKKTVSLAASVVIGMLGFALFITIASIIATIWPYNEFSQEPKEPNENGEATITTDTGELTEDGIPIVEQKLSYEVETCNNGVNIFVEKWLDSYGKYSTTSKVSLEDTEKSGSILIAVQEFYVPEPVCTDGTIEVTIPGRVNRDILYKLRVTYSYKGNILNTVSDTKYTELFYLSPNPSGNENE